MQIRVRPLTLTLLAVVSCCAAARAQPPGTVNIRPGVASAQAGVPEVRITADQHRVRVGAEVTFTLSPASVVGNPRFTVTICFGDGAQQEMRQTKVVHRYRAPGTYTYCVLVKPTPTPIASPTPSPTPIASPTPSPTPIASRTPSPTPIASRTPSPTPIASPTRSPTPRLPISVKLIANPITVATNSPVNFVAQLSRNYPNIQYRFVFADGAQTDWQYAPQTSHRYAAAKTYLAFVDIREGSGGLLGGSQRQPIQVTPPQNVRVDLLVTPPSVKTGDTVRFDVQTNYRDQNVKYRFTFGDGAITGWLDSPSTNHKYTVAKDYFASVEVGLLSNRTIKTLATSNPAMIGVATRLNPKPTPSPRPSPTPIQSPSPSPSVSPSPTVSPTPTPTPTCGPFSWRDPFGWRCWPWWIYLLLALLGIFLAYKAARYLLLPRPKFVPNHDPGVSRVGAGKPLSIDLELALDPNVTGGQYGLETPEGSLIKSERGSNG